MSSRSARALRPRAPSPAASGAVFGAAGSTTAVAGAVLGAVLGAVAAAGCDDGAATRAYVDRSKRAEAELMLRAIQRAAYDAWFEARQFPVADASPTPAARCCTGAAGRCAPDPGAWQTPAWTALRFEVTEPHYFQYAYRSTDGRTFEAVAVGDLDCDGTTIAFTLRGRVGEGEPVFAIEPPAGAD